MRAQEFVTELFGLGKPKENAKAHRDGIDLEIFNSGGAERQINATSHGRDLGRVLFDVQLQGKDTILIAKDLMILPKYRGQGIAATMYDWAKELGYKVERSPEQTDAGKAFWNKNRGEEGNVWENFADGRNPQDKGDAKRHGINTKASVSSLRKTAKQGGRKGHLAHWLANMKAGRAKKK